MRINRRPLGRLAWIGFLTIVGFFLLTEHRAHLFGWWPLLLLLALPAVAIRRTWCWTKAQVIIGGSGRRMVIAWVSEPIVLARARRPGAGDNVHEDVRALTDT